MPATSAIATHAENRRLLAQNAALEADRRQLRQLQGQLTIDRELGVTSYAQVVAQVSEEAPSVWYSHVTIDAAAMPVSARATS